VRQERGAKSSAPPCAPSRSCSSSGERSHAPIPTSLPRRVVSVGRWCGRSAGTSLPEIPAALSVQCKDFMMKCIQRDVSKRARSRSPPLLCLLDQTRLFVAGGAVAQLLSSSSPLPFFFPRPRCVAGMRAEEAKSRGS
jgi:hypothetical protein